MQRYWWPGFEKHLLVELQRQQNNVQFCDTLLQTEGEAEIQILTQSFSHNGPTLVTLTYKNLSSTVLTDWWLWYTRRTAT